MTKPVGTIIAEIFTFIINMSTGEINYQVSSRIYVPVRLPPYYWDCLMRVTDIRGSARISAHSVVFFLYYRARLVLYFSTRKECCSHDYHVVSATQEHNDNSSLYLRSLSHIHSFIHTCSLFFCISPGLLRAQDSFWLAKHQLTLNQRLQSSIWIKTL